MSFFLCDHLLLPLYFEKKTGKGESGGGRGKEEVEEKEKEEEEEAMHVFIQLWITISPIQIL